MYSAVPPKFEFDFIPRAFRWPNLLGWIMLLAGCTLTGFVVKNFFLLQESKTKSEAQLASIQRLQMRSQHTVKAAAAQKAVPEAEQIKLAAIAKSLQYPWSQIFSAFESATNADIALLEFQPHAEKARVSIRGQARTLKAAFDFAARLGQAAKISSARVQNYEFKQSEGVQVVEFLLEANLDQ